MIILLYAACKNKTMESSDAPKVNPFSHALCRSNGKRQMPNIQFRDTIVIAEGGKDRGLKRECVIFFYGNLAPVFYESDFNQGV